jgi:hypothetical protein
MFPNLKGIVGALLMTISALAGLNDPQYKVTPVGFLQMLLEHGNTANVVNLEELRLGYTRDIQIRYMQRGVSDDVTDVDDCDAPITAAWQTKSLGNALFSKIGIHIDDILLRKLEDAAAQPVSMGSPATGVTMALYQTILTQLNGLIQKIDKNLLQSQTTAWGINTVTGSNAPQTITFTNEPSMTDGIVKLISDYQLNEIAGTPQLVGNGIITNYDILQSLKRGIDGGGFGANPVNVYGDVNSVSIWGANHFGIFVPGLTSFVDYQKYVGVFSGYKGGSYFFTLPVPMILANGKLTSLIFDAQLKYNDCPIKDDDGAIIAERGWSLIISKNYQLFNAPNDMFRSADRLNGFNGSLHYIGATVV